MIVPKFIYGLSSLIGDHQGVKTQITNFLYQTLKSIAGIRMNPNKEALLTFFLGVHPDVYIDALA